jgi:apolipoprotein N-acyltransferase
MEVAEAPANTRDRILPNYSSRLLSLFLCAILAAFSFHLAFFFFPPALLFYAYFLLQLSDAPRAGFRFGFLVGIATFAPHLAWFWEIFGPAAICLWAVLAFFTGLFVLTVSLWRARFGLRYLWLSVPVFWTGIEFFRSELYYLRFSWLTPGYTLLANSHFPASFGVYGSGFILFLLGAISFCLPVPKRWYTLVTAFILLISGCYIPLAAKVSSQSSPTKLLHVAGIQLEFPPELQVPDYLDSVFAHHPDADLFVLSEYAFEGPVPTRVRNWCKKHRKFLIAGGKKSVGEKGWYNTAFVIGPDGELVFEQAKSVPIQFFNDGLPAKEQRIWNSPWGKIGICICYDLSYRKVVDHLVEQRAQALIVPFMDVTDWGGYQHRLHSIVPPVRAREYRIPIFRVGSSGISQLINRSGTVIASAPFPGQESIIAETIQLADPGRLPLDHYIAPTCSVLVALWYLVMLSVSVKEKIIKRPPPKRIAPL